MSGNSGERNAIGCLDNWRCLYLNTCPVASCIYELVFLSASQRQGRLNRLPDLRADFGPKVLSWTHGEAAGRTPIVLLSTPGVEESEPWSRPAGSRYPESSAMVPKFPLPFLDYLPGEREELWSRAWRRSVSPRSAEQDGLIEMYGRLAKSIGEKEGRSHPDRIRFKYGWPELKGWKTPPPARGGPEDELQVAHLALVKVLTPRTSGGALYSPRPGVDFSVV